MSETLGDVLLLVIGAIFLVALYVGIFGLAAYLDRRVFPNGFSRQIKGGWLVLGVLLGACIGSGFSGNCSDGRAQRLESAIHTMDGAVIGVVIEMAIDLTKNFPRKPISFQFRLWHLLAFVFIFSVSLRFVLTYIELLNLRSMRL